MQKSVSTHATVHSRDRCGAFDQKIVLSYLNQYFQKMNYSLNVLKEIEIKDKKKILEENYP
ncbi:hypothetical protein, partial [Xanthomarina gelatinilytica]|uniref:hypothetical protein n=1 Tax=Xanthomarina gelatinilytica TaxID=1137281 RepID=UPI003AA81A54